MTIKEAENQYQKYLTGHIGNVNEALELLHTLDISFINDNFEELKSICSQHDASKYSDEEYEPYREHFYPINEDEELKTEAFDVAVKHHIKNNKHHWDYWLDENNNLNIPDEQEYKLYCVERCCDWLAMANQHEEVASDWYNANRDAIIMPDYGWELCDEIMSKVPEDCNLSYRGTRGKLDEADEYDLKQEIIRVKGKKYLDGIIRKSHGNIGYYALKRIVDGLYDETNEKKAKQSDTGVSEDEYKQAMEEKKKKPKRVYYDAGYETDESNEEKDKIRKELGEQFNVIRGENGYLIEANMSQLKRKTLSEDPTRAKKSKQVQSKYIGISKYGVLNFETTSETHSGVKWYQEVHFPSFDGFLNIVEQGDVIEPEDVKKAMSSDNLKISCFDGGTLVQTDKGMKQIKDIQVGEKVLTYTGKYQEVLQTFENDYSGEMIEINGIKSTPNHPYLVKLPDGSIDWKMACEITKDMKLLEVNE